LLPLRTAKICENKSYCKLITTKKREFSQYEDETLRIMKEKCPERSQQTFWGASYLITILGNIFAVSLLES